MILAADDNWMVVVRNLEKSRAVLRRMTRILIREGAEPRVSVLLFKSVIQLVMIFGADICVVTPTWAGSWGI